MKHPRENAVRFALLLVIAVSVLAGTVAITHYLSDSAKVTAEPGGGSSDCQTGGSSTGQPRPVGGFLARDGERQAAEL